MQVVNEDPGRVEPEVRPANLQSEAILHAGKCRSWAAKTFNDAPDAALCVGAGDRLLYAAQLLDMQAREIQSLRATLAMVADISQSGGLALQSPFDALVSVRRLTLEHWNRQGSEDEHRERVLAAASEARIRGLRT